MDPTTRFSDRLSDFDLTAPAAKLEYNRRLFRAVSRRYRALTPLLSFGQDGSWKRRLVRMLPPGPRGRALDLACGTGDIAYLLARRYWQGSVTGVDLSPEMVARALRRAGTVPGGGVRFQIGDMTRLPAAAQSMDVVTGGYALRNAPDLRAVLTEVHRVLRPGGTAAFLEFTKSHRPAVRRLQLALLGLWGGLWGWLLHRNPEVYAYIARSLALFPDRPGLASLLRDTGFRNIRFRTLSAGFVAITRCTRERL